ncbi:MAG: DUF2167 domain-containing protein [Chitinophagaceae bacterium]|nr:DUF2167 domain-containing protein [Chitinophagaceae bacterium]
MLPILVAMFLLNTVVVKAQDQDTNDSINYSIAMDELKMIIAYYDSINSTIEYQTGTVELEDVAELNIPEGYKFVPQDKARMIVEDLWGNPEDPSILGMLVTADYSVGMDDNWAFIISFEDIGYVKDEDADDIDYDELMENIQKSEKEVNKERLKQGYSSVHVLGWAAKPFYDKERKALHWAKKIKFGTEQQEDGDLTLNYDVRFLGRKGVLSMNAVGIMSQLDDVNAHIDDILTIAKFKKGNAYSDFNPSVDKVAAYTIGGLIAGKLLAKTGIMILLLKNIKLILLAIAGFFGAFRKKIFGFFRKNKEEEVTRSSSDTDFLEAPVEEEQTDNQGDESAPTAEDDTPKV